ncbi:MAG: hypothetical protein ACREU8_04625, partial [Gammaproteobacteria bacterium]
MRRLIPAASKKTTGRIAPACQNRGILIIRLTNCQVTTGLIFHDLALLHARQRPLTRRHIRPAEIGEAGCQIRGVLTLAALL